VQLGDGLMAAPPTRENATRSQKTFCVRRIALHGVGAFEFKTDRQVRFPFPPPVLWLAVAPGSCTRGSNQQIAS